MKNPAISVVTIAVLAASLFFASGNVSAQARHRQPHHQVEQSRGATIALRPTNIKRGTSLNLTVTSPSGFDLSSVGVERVAIVPPDGISHLEALHQNPGANELTVEFSIDESAKLAVRTLIIFDGSQVVAGSATFNVRADFPDHCPGNEQCCSSDAKTGLCNQCRPHCPVPSNNCPVGKRCCDPGPGCSCTPKTQSCR